MITTPPRAFNEIIDLGDYYLKLSRDIPKILSEVEFYKSLPSNLKKFYPEVDFVIEAHENKAGYKIRKIPVPDASHFFVANKPEQNSVTYFNNLLQKLNEYLAVCPTKTITLEQSNLTLEQEIIDKDIARLILIKQLPEAHRLEETLRLFGFTNFDSYLKIIHDNLKVAHKKLKKHELIFSHGDMCLSNMLQHEGQLFLIDPKGCLAKSSNLRSPYYDYAKLSQCFYGHYDYINLLKFKAHKSDYIYDENPDTMAIRELFQKFCEDKNIDNDYLKCIQATFFFSMIPLHFENFDKMNAFLISSIRSWSPQS